MIICFIGSTELLLIGGLVFLLFGGKKFPEMMKGLGKGVKEFKHGLKEDNPETESKSEETSESSINSQKQETDSSTNE